MSGLAGRKSFQTHYIMPQVTDASQLFSSCLAATSNERMPKPNNLCEPCVMCSSQNIWSGPSEHRRWGSIKRGSDSYQLLCFLSLYGSAAEEARLHLGYNLKQMLVNIWLQCNTTPPDNTWPVLKGLVLHLHLHIPRPLIFLAVTAHAFCSSPLCSSFGKATVATAVWCMTDNRGWGGAQQSFAALFLHVSHLHDRCPLDLQLSILIVHRSLSCV